MKNAIEATDLGKRYRMRGLAPPTLHAAVRRWFCRSRPEVFWALRHVDFRIPRGATVGLIGPNGSGKSSLLGLTAGTIFPTEGTLSVEGRIAALLELGAGFHPDLTGRENVFLNAAILGIPQEDIRRRMGHIEAFSGLGEFMDMPVKHYSSGMYVRLGFAVAVETDPDILLIDEVLAVGDIAFQLKCLDRIRDFQRRGKTLVFVSHALQTVEEFCDEVFLFHKGRMVSQGLPQDVILEYIRSYMGEGGYLYTQEFGTRDIEIVDVRMLDESGREAGAFTSGQPMHVDLTLHARRPLPAPVVGFSVKTGNGFYIYGSNTDIDGLELPPVRDHLRVRLSLDPLRLMNGNFFLSLAVHSADHETQYHRREDWYPFAVRRAGEAPGIFELAPAWQIDSEAGPAGTN